MQNIFLDTNIFIKDNFLGGLKIRQLFRLSEHEHIRLILTRITIEEIKSNFRRHVKKAIKNHEDFMNLDFSIVLKNDPIEKTLFRQLNKREIIQGFNTELDRLILKSNVTIIEYSELNIQNVFDRYFANKPPFHHQDKKHEFPDAFTIELLEQWCNEENEDCTVFTLDKGIKVDESSKLTVSDAYEGFLDEKLRELISDRVNVLEKLFDDNSTAIDVSIVEWYTDKLCDESLYYHFVFEEVHDIEVVEVNILEKSYAIVSNIDADIDIEISAEVEYVVRLTIDDSDSSVYDYEDKMTLYFDTKVRDVKGYDTAIINASAYIASVNNYDESLEIMNINEGFELHVSDDTEDWR